MTHASAPTFTAFANNRRIATGTRDQVIAALRPQAAELTALFVFDDATGEPIDLDLRDTAISKYSDAVPCQEPSTRSVGRPKLGVVAREVTLLPRHWDWLNRQPGGASVALRKLVEDARRINADRDAVRAARERSYRFMSAIAGHEAGFEEAARALFAGDRQRFDDLIADWPGDVRAHLRGLSEPGWSAA